MLEAIARRGLLRLIRQGRMQRSLSLMAGMSSLLGGLDAATEHYHGSYGQRVMWTPIILSPLLLGAGLWAAQSRRAARTVLPAVSALTLADSLIGFGFHIRGVARKPGGWRLPVFNLSMGPPIFAPILFGLGGYFGLLASLNRREDRSRARLAIDRAREALRPRSSWRDLGLARDVRQGRFQKPMAASTMVASFLSGAEAFISHYKNNFQYKAQWTPVVIAPLLGAAATGAIFSRRSARTPLRAASALAIADGALGFFYHLRGVKRRAGGLTHASYNLVYGPPSFAPLLLCASGVLGLLASFMRRK
ncbi:MAG: hypothetical protein ACHQ17_09220 [Polyangia bacterium]